MSECKLTSLANLFCAFEGRGDGKQGEGVPFMGREVGLGFLRNLVKLGDDSGAHGSVLSITLWLQLLSLPLFFRVCFRAVATFILAYHMSQFFRCQKWLGRVIHRCGNLGHSSALKHTKCWRYCSAALKGGNSSPGTRFWLLLDFQSGLLPSEEKSAPPGLPCSFPLQCPSRSLRSSEGKAIYPSLVWFRSKTHCLKSLSLAILKPNASIFLLVKMTETDIFLLPFWFRLRNILWNMLLISHDAAITET